MYKMDMIKNVKTKIDDMKPWEIMERYMLTANKYENTPWEEQEFGGIPAEDEALFGIVEAGAFRLSMKYGELQWLFDMPSSKESSMSGRPHTINIYWDEFVPEADAISYRKEIHIPYRDCGISGFVHVIRKEMDETMARKLANDLLETSKEEV